jgi:hypothetical protein
MTLHTPITVDDEGTLIDARGHEIADLWVIDEQGRMRVSDANTAAMRERAAEIVRRVNLHDSLVGAIRQSRDRLRWAGKTTEEIDYVLAKVEGR